MRLLTIDIGNSRIKCGMFDASNLVGTFDMASDLQASGAAYRHALRAHVGDFVPQATAIASVVPSLNERVSVAAQREFMVLPEFVRAEDLPAEVVGYAAPESLGADRIAAAIAAHRLYGSDEEGNPRPVVVVDAGTAVTFEVVDAAGTYCGGAIWAGPSLVADALNRGTSLLPKVTRMLPRSALGRDTEACITSGVLYGFVDGVSGLLGRLCSEVENPAVVATGGLGEWICRHVEDIGCYDAHLVLHGIRLMVQDDRLRPE